jgi:hypothetical protein
LSFELNQGQTDQEVNYLARGPGYNLFLTPREAVLTLKKPQAHPKDRQAKSGPATSVSGTVLRLQFVGARPQPHAVGQDLLPGKVNYFIGRDPHRWHTGIPTYAKVKYEGVYPGVDLIYYGHQGQLEYDWVLAPGTDPKVLTLAIEGAAGLEVEKGELVVHTPEGDLHMHKPVIYQERKGYRYEVGGGYVLKDKHHVGFEVASYDTSRPLVIDPVLVYSTFLGGSDGDAGTGIAVDGKGQAYVTGLTLSADFPTAHALQPTLNSNSDAFVSKLTPAGSALVYSTFLGGSGFEGSVGIAVDGKGQAYVTGSTNSADFPTAHALQPTFGGFEDAFVTKLSTAKGETEDDTRGEVIDRAAITER